MLEFFNRNFGTLFGLGFLYVTIGTAVAGVVAIAVVFALTNSAGRNQRD